MLFGADTPLDPPPAITTADLLAPKEPTSSSSTATETNAFPNPNPNPNPSSSIISAAMAVQEVKPSLDLSTDSGVVNIPQEWKIKKRLTESDLNSASRLMLPRKSIEEGVLSLMHDDMKSSVVTRAGLKTEMVDDETGSVHNNAVFKLWQSCKCYIINGCWAKYAKSRNLRTGDEVGLRWDTEDCRFHICVLKRADGAVAVAEGTGPGEPRELISGVFF